MITRSTLFKFLNISALTLAISLSLVSIAQADVNDDPPAGSNGRANGQPASAATGALSDKDDTTGSVTLEHFQGGHIKTIQLHCSLGTVPRFDDDGSGVVKMSCERLSH